MSDKIKVSKIISGGQSGVDLGALKAGRYLKLQTGGWMPKHWMTENGKRPEYKELYGMEDCSIGGYKARTVKNVQDSDGTLIIGDRTMPGTRLTMETAFKMQKPYFWVPFYWNRSNMKLLLNAALPAVAEWLVGKDIKVLNVAGNRESKNQGIGKFTEEFLIELLEGADGEES